MICQIMLRGLRKFIVTAVFTACAAIPCVTYGQAEASSDATTETLEPTEQTLPPKIPSVERAEETGLRLNFRGASLDSVLDYMSAQFGFVIMREVDVDARVDVVSHQPLTPEEAVDLLNTVLHSKGYAAVRNGRILRIVRRDEALTRNLPVYKGSNPNDIPESDQMVTQVIPVKYANAVQLKDDLAALIPTYASITANESSNAIVLTDTQSNIKRMCKIISSLDTSLSAISEVRVFPLEYADADDAAQLIDEIFDVESQSSSRRSRSSDAGSSFFQRFMSGGPGGAPGGQSSRNDRSSSDARTATARVIASADDRTNTLVVSAPSEFMPTIVAVIDSLDSNPTMDLIAKVYVLANANAENVADILEGLFSETSDTSSRTSSRTSGRDNQRSGTTRPTSASAGASAVTDSEVFIKADEDTNSLIVLTDNINHALIKEVIDELDKAVPQALIKVLIAEVTHSKDLDIGAEFKVIGDVGSGFEDTFETLFGLGSESSGAIVKVLDEDLEITLRALETIGELEILSRPSIMTSNTQEANITVGQEVPFITNSRVTSDGQLLNTVDYRDIGIILNVTPHINNDGVVVMDVAPEISTLTGETVRISEDFDAAVYAKRSAASRVVVPDGKTVVIGGLMEDRETKTIRKVPLLGSIPIVGALFRRDISKTEKTELLIFLTPYVVQEYEAIAALTEKEKAQVELLPDTISSGKYERYLNDK